MQRIKKIAIQSAKPLINMFPFFLGMVLLISFVNTAIPKTFYEKIFSKNIFLDSIIGSSLGSILAGNSITSYVMGGEFLRQGVSLVAVTAFLVSWVTVGILQFVVEVHYFGKKFTIIRNLLSFVFSILVAIITVLIYKNV
jgi:uncharacterized membrane protein YraQ (UPF0718 family)